MVELPDKPVLTFFGHMGFNWQSPGMGGGDAYKEVVRGMKPQCSCGVCVEGVMSKRMLEKLRRVADT